MTIATGTKLGPYEITHPVGAGGMGEVYKARDTRLDRTVAVKVLPEHLANDAALRERFEREARAVSSLNHPHICTLHDVGEHDGVHYLVMEHIEGETLADRLKKGALPLYKALEIASQIADALDKAHRAGIVHRDLKPGNIMLTKAGVKLLDFGLAKTREEPIVPTEDSEQPTQNKPLTDVGTILGTVQYMAPEQLEGKEVDARADLFSLGAVLYEMLTGRKAFEGSSQASLISAIMSTEPALVSELQTMSPPALDRVVKRCLTKDPDVRWQTARDLTEELTWIRESPATGPATPASRPMRTTLIALSLGLVALGLAGLIWSAWPRHPPPQVTRFTVGTYDDSVRMVTSTAPSITVSPDGRYLIMVAAGPSRHLVVRDLSALEARPLAGTETASYYPFFSPDSERIAFTTTSQLKTLPVGGGEPRVVCNLDGIFGGGSWSSDNRILFSSQTALHLVPANGGNPEVVLELDNEAESLVHPRWLPGSRYALVTIRRGNEHTLYAFNLESRELVPLMPNAAQASYVESGHIVFVRDTRTGAGDVFAAGFDPDTPSLLGVPVRVPEPIWTSTPSGGAFMAVSESGTLAYVPARTLQTTHLSWIDSGGRATPLPIEPDVFRRPSLSPDGKRLAIDSHPGGAAEHDVWIYHLDTGTRSRLTVEGHNAAPIWTPDGLMITFASRRPSSQDLQRIFWQPADASRDAELLLARDYEIYPVSWSPDGKNLAFVEQLPGQSDVWVLPLGGDPVPLLTSTFQEHSPMFSPDGHWLAYVSDESGREEVYVRSFPGEGPKIPISTGGGREPVWSRDGAKLFFRSLDGTEMWATAVDLGPPFHASKPELLFTRRFYVDTTRQQTYDVSPDGERFLIVEELQGQWSEEIVVVMNWSEELKRLVPVE